MTRYYMGGVYSSTKRMSKQRARQHLARVSNKPGPSKMRRESDDCCFAGPAELRGSIENLGFRAPASV